MVFVYPYRVRYGDSDPMNMAFYARYMYWMEEARTEFFRFLGIPYKEIEKKGFYLPVLESYLRYKSPCFYDDLIYIETIVSKLKFQLIEFKYRIHRESELLLCSGWTKHAFIDCESSPQSIQKFFLKNIPLRDIFPENFLTETLDF